jgi:hypothetical protein
VIDDTAASCRHSHRVAEAQVQVQGSSYECLAKHGSLCLHRSDLLLQFKTSSLKTWALKANNRNKDEHR